MSAQMIELEEAALAQTSDDALEDTVVACKEFGTALSPYGCPGA